MGDLSKSVGFIALISLSAVTIGAAHGEVISAAINGFEVRESTHVAASTAKAYSELLKPSGWWSAIHTLSKKSANLTLDARVGGCWCENIPEVGGAVEHMRIVALIPGKLLRLRGSLGPLQDMGVDGTLSFTLTSRSNGTDITVDYAVGGYGKDGFGELSRAVDQVLGEQLFSLRKLIEG